MNDLDLFDMSDRELFADRLFGNLIPRPGWSRRGAIVRRALQVAGLTILVVLLLIAASGAIVLGWAARS